MEKLQNVCLFLWGTVKSRIARAREQFKKEFLAKRGTFSKKTSSNK